MTCAEKWCVKRFYIEDNPHIKLDEVTGLVANTNVISKASVYHARKEQENGVKLVE
jgi:hypothetical protein